MKGILFSAILVVLTSATPDDDPLTKSERVFAVNYLNETVQDLVKAVKGLSKTQLQYKAGPDKWSIAQCLEHIALAETAISANIEALQKQVADPSKRAEIKYSDDALIKVLTNRSQKLTTPESLKPSGKFQQPEDALKAISEQRQKTAEWIGSTREDLRDHVMAHPFFGMLDSYQWVLFIAAHGKRHTLQIEEVKASANFPKN